MLAGQDGIILGGMELRPAAEADVGLYFYIAQDPEVRAQSFTADVPSWESHVRWYERERASGLFYVAEQNGEPVGVIRFQRVDQPIVSLAVVPAWRGLGLGLDILRDGTSFCAHAWGQPIWAEVKAENVASQHIFQQAGYELMVFDERAAVYRWNS